MILIGLILLGALIGLFIPIEIERQYVTWIVVALFCTTDAFLTELNVYLSKKGGTHVLTRIIFNLAFGYLVLTLGHRLGFELYIVVLIPFAIRILNNLNWLKDHIFELVQEGEVVLFRERRRVSGGGE